MESDQKSGLNTWIHNASYNGDMEYITSLIERGADINSQNEYGQTPLWVAFNQGRISCARFLLKLGANPNTKDCYGDTLLHRFCQLKFPEYVKILLENGADPSILDRNDQTAKEVALKQKDDICAYVIDTYSYAVTKRAQH